MRQERRNKRAVYDWTWNNGGFMRKGLYANIHAKRKRGGKMRKKGAKGAPTAAQFARAARTARRK
jgi:hypothetical protein